MRSTISLSFSAVFWYPIVVARLSHSAAPGSTLND
jgi:hypothetical protein